MTAGATVMSWAPSLPLGWDVVRGRYLFSRLSRPPLGDGVVTAFRDGIVTLRSNRRSDGFTFADKEIGYQGVRSGDLVVHSMDGFAGAIGVSDSDGKCSPVCVICRGRGDVDLRFYAYVLRHMALSGFITSLARGIRERSTAFGWRELSEQPLPCPPLGVQRAIADVLDRKTAAIDALIEKKERLLALLAEKRAALIHRAVTQGLDPTVPMKDSGIPWIGEIPAHWEVGRLKQRYHYVTSGPRGWGQYYADAGDLFLRITNVDRGAIDLLLAPDKLQRVAAPPGAEGDRTRVKPGDLLVTITADIGSVGVVPDGIDGAYVSQHIALCRSTAPHLSRFYGYCALSAWGQGYFQLMMDGGTKLGLALDDVRTMPVPLLPAHEAEQVSLDLDRRLNDLSVLVGSSLRSIEKLREYRQALIAAAVTGQLAIDEVAA